MLGGEDTNTFQWLNSSGLFNADSSMEELIEMYLFKERRLIPRLENALVTWMMMLVKMEGKVVIPSIFNHA